MQMMHTALPSVVSMFPEYTFFWIQFPSIAASALLIARYVLLGYDPRIPDVRDARASTAVQQYFYRPYFYQEHTADTIHKVLFMPLDTPLQYPPFYACRLIIAQ